MKCWVLKSKTGEYLCNCENDVGYMLRKQEDLLCGCELVFSSKKKNLSKITEKWNIWAVRHYHINICLVKRVKPIQVKFKLEPVIKEKKC